MKIKKERVYSRHTREAAILLGKHIQWGRKERHLSEMDLADRAGISRLTLRKMEKGNPKCELGLYFEVATIVGVILFGADSSRTLSAGIERMNDKLALLPKSIHKKKQDVDDAF